MARTGGPTTRVRRGWRQAGEGRHRAAQGPTEEALRLDRSCHLLVDADGSGDAMQGMQRRVKNRTDQMA